MVKEIRTKMTVRDAIAMYPDLLNEPIENMAYPRDGYYPSTAEFQLTGDGHYRSGKVNRLDNKEIKP